MTSKIYTFYDKLSVQRNAFIAICLVLVFLPISGYPLSQQYKQCAKEVLGASMDDCGINDEYDRLHEKMEIVYKMAVESKPELLKDQSKWLEKLKKDCPEDFGTSSSYGLHTQCLAEETEARLSQLENNIKDIVSTKNDGAIQNIQKWLKNLVANTLSDDRDDIEASLQFVAKQGGREGIINWREEKNWNQIKVTKYTLVGTIHACVDVNVTGYKFTHLLDKTIYQEFRNVFGGPALIKGTSKNVWLPALGAGSYSTHEECVKDAEIGA